MGLACGWRLQCLALFSRSGPKIFPRGRMWSLVGCRSSAVSCRFADTACCRALQHPCVSPDDGTGHHHAGAGRLRIVDSGLPAVPGKVQGHLQREARDVAINSLRSISGMGCLLASKCVIATAGHCPAVEEEEKDPVISYAPSSVLKATLEDPYLLHCTSLLSTPAHLSQTRESAPAPHHETPWAPMRRECNRQKAAAPRAGIKSRCPRLGAFHNCRLERCAA
jgi:hypothetical protein